MKIKSSEKAQRLEEVQEYYSRAANVASARKEDFKKFDAQYKGSHEIEVKGKDSEGNYIDGIAYASAVDNITFELIEGSIDTDIPQPAVTPAIKCEHNVRNARRIENLIKHLLDKLPFELYNDAQERSVKKFGTAGTNIEWDTTTFTRSTVGEVSVSVLRPQSFYPQPGISDIADCDYIFVDYVTTRAEIMRRYNLSEKDVEDTEFRSEYEEDSDEGIRDEDVVTLTVLWYRNEGGTIGRFVYSGDLVLEDDGDYYARRVEYCSFCHRRAEICRADKCKKPKYYKEELEYDELTEDIQCSDGRVIPAMSPVIKDGVLQTEKVKLPVTRPDGTQATAIVGGVELPQFMEIEMPKMKPTRLPFYKPKTLPVAIRYNIRDDNSFWGISDCEMIREDQQRINKLTTRIDDAVKKAGAILGIPEDSEISASNGIFEEIVRLGPGVTKEQFMLFSYAVDITQWIAERENIRESAKKKIGVSDSFLGQADNTAKSGYAKSLQIAQSAGRLSAKKVMKQTHFAACYRIMFELTLAFADEAREIYHEDQDCKLAAEDMFRRPDFYEFDPMTGEWYINDNFTFSIDLNGAIEQQYPQLWEIVKADYASGMYGNPASIDTIIMAWQHLEQLKYPFARNVVEAQKALRDSMIEAQQMQAQQMQAQQAQLQAQNAAGQLPQGNSTSGEAEISGGEQK